MIIQQNNADHIISGDIIEIKTTIDAKNLDYITTLLSSNLYSNPEKSFVREIISNAWDSHIAAKTTDKPIIIKYDETTKSIIIRDYGTGLSKEQFVELYCSIGNSSKRNSNEFIGGFGIGRYSSLAVSNIVSINSYYNGEKYMYILSKSNNNIKTDLISVLNTEEPNGLEIIISDCTHYTRSKIFNSLKDLIFFPNIYFDIPEYSSFKLNDTKIKKYKYFSVSTVSTNDRLLVGNVIYPLSFSEHIYGKDAEIDLLFNKIPSSLVFNIPIGSIDITPNRENIIYTEKTINLIVDIIKKALREIKDLLNDGVNNNTTSLKDYISKFIYKERTSRYDLLTNTHITNVTTSSLSYQDFIINYLYKGNIINHKLLLHICKCYHIKYNMHYVYKYYSSNLYFTERVHNYNFLTLQNTNNIVVLKNFSKFTPTIKQYIQNKLKPINFESAFIYDVTEQKFTEHINAVFDKFTFTYDKQDLASLIKLYYKDVIEQALILDFESDDFKDFKKQLKEKRANQSKETIISDDICVYYIFNKHLDEYKTKYTCTKNALYKALKKLKKRIILVPYTYKELNCSFLSIIMPNTIFITASQSILKFIKNLNLKNVFDIDSIYTDKALINCKTFISFCDNAKITSVSGWATCFDYLAPIYKDKLFDLFEFFKLLNSSSYDLCYRYNYSKCINHDSIAINTSLYEQLSNYYDIYTYYDNIYRLYRNSEIALLACLKQKKFLPSYKTYKKIKNSTIYSLLWNK
jgi:hypothetical protein